MVGCCGAGVALQRQLAPLVWELLSEVEALSLDANTAAQTAPFIETLQVSAARTFPGCCLCLLVR